MPIQRFERGGPPIDVADLDALEDRLGVKLPPQYRAFLLRVNGGTPRPERCFDNHKGVESLVFMFYAVKHERVSLTLAQSAWQLEDRVPSVLLPIAYDAGGNQICIGVSGRHYGRVYFWDMEGEADSGRKPWWRNVTLITRTFDEFIDLFYDCDQEPP